MPLRSRSEARWLVEQMSCVIPGAVSRMPAMSIDIIIDLPICRDVMNAMAAYSSSMPQNSRIAGPCMS